MGLAEFLLMALIALLVLAVPGLLITIIYMLRQNKKDTSGSSNPGSNTSNNPTEI